MARETPVCDEDVFGSEAVRNARAVDDRLRETAPAVKISRENITLVGRYEEVSKGLQDYRTFSSRSRPWHDPSSVRPEILLVDDPPKHTRVRNVIASALTPRTLTRMASAFEADADALMRRVKEKSGEPIDAVGEITRAFVDKVLPDLLGLPKWGRENLSPFGHMVWATLGPQNELYREAMENVGPVLEWVDQCCNRENLDPQGLGMQMFIGADQGLITHDEAKLLVQVLLSAAADTTVMTMATAIRAFCLFPEQYALLRSQPELLRNAFEESLRWDSPSRMAGRITTREVELQGYRIPEGGGQPRSAQVERSRPLRHPPRPQGPRRLGLRAACLRRARARAARGRCAARGLHPPHRAVRAGRRARAVDVRDRARAGAAAGAHPSGRTLKLPATQESSACRT